MSRRTSEILRTMGYLAVGIFLTLTALTSTVPRAIQQMWWIFLIIGIALTAGSLIEFGFAATHPNKIPCPYCGKNTVPKARHMTGHLYLSRSDDD